MFCQNCGTKLKNDARFCINCGRAQAVIPPVQPVIPPAAPVSFADKVRATAKKVGASPAFLAAVICFTLTLILNLLSLGSISSGIDTYADLLATYIADVSALTGSLKGLFLAVGIVGMIPSVLIAVGLWITYGTCVSRKPRVNTTGLTMIFVVNLVQLVLGCVALLAIVIPLALVYAGVEELFMADEDIVEALLIGAGLVILAVFAFAMIYYIKVCTSLSNIRSTMKTGVPNKKASRFVAIMCYISGGILILSGISDLFSAGTVSLDSYYEEGISYILPSTYFLSGISSLLNAAVQILFGVVIFSYRSKMEALETEARMNNFKELSYAEPYTSPVYIPPQPAAEPEPTPEPQIAEEPEITEEPATEETE